MKLLVLAALLAAAPYQNPIARLEPNGERPVFINPPTFRWPQDKPGEATLQFSRGADFSQPVQVVVKGESFYRPLQPMQPGRWYWRVRQGGSGWSQTAVFDLPENAVRWPIESWTGALARIPARHPRLWVTPERAAELRREAAGPLREMVAEWSKSARRYLDQPLPLEQDKPRTKTEEFEKKAVQRVSSKADAGRTVGPAGELAFLYLLTGREEFAREARRRAMAAARLDPGGYTSHEVSDFANSSIIVNCARVYDYLYDILPEQERSALRKMLLERVRRVFAAYRPRLEQRWINAHAWQHVLMDATAGALALYGEEPEAREWFDWSQRLHVAVFPWYGGAEGGSAEGANYYSCCNMLQSLTARDLFHSATGIDLARNPWFSNNAYYLIYSHPPGGLISQFGDNNGSREAPGETKKLAALRHASLFNNPYSAAYAAAIQDKPGAGWLAALWTPFQTPAPKPLSSLPPARAFSDIGVVFIHSSIANPSENVFFEFKSSPYGSSGHAHADQNTFNIALAGEPLIIDSGYYTAFGDEHHFGYATQTKAHNGILVDGEGQEDRTLEAFGSLARFEQQPGMAYALGSAAGAYSKVKLKRFERHVLWLEPRTYVIADDIEADGSQPRRYDWLLHASREMKVDEANRTVIVSNAKGQARVSFLAPRSLKFQQTSGFEPAPRAWLPTRKGRQFPDQWHLRVTPDKPGAAERFLVVIQVERGASPQFPALPALRSDPKFQDAWRRLLPTRGWRVEDLLR